ncbi:MAG TPA: PLP-dependent aminotransferase family protein [Candidatus Limnocylindrales bacterium]|nr:PLP-dependent aminotransferase family protein [Candidatus Limnocylindrales bacterium]
MTGSIASARTRQIDRATLALNRDAPAALHRQLEAGLRSAIAEGRLQPGAPLPGTRTLAEELGVARITVATAYEQLVAEGYLDASARSGTRVARDLPATGFRLGDAHGAGHDAVSDLGGIYPAPNPGIPLAPVTMDDGLPDDEIDLGPESFSLASVDRRAWERRLVAAWREIAAEERGGAVSYFGGLGDPVLRQALSDHLAVHRAVRARPDAIAITSGATAALAAVARVWLGPGRRCVVEEPGGSQLRRSLSIAGAEIVPVAVDVDGLDPDGLPDHADVCFVTPSWQYPSGGRMSVARRLALIDWARRVGALIVEDDCEGELRYAGDPLPTLAGLAEDGRVIYVNTFSKVLFPGLRTGYVVVPDRHRGPLLAALEAGARSPGALEQRALGRFVESGAYVRHLRRVRMRYASLRETFDREIRRRAGDRLRVRQGEAGGHLLVEIAPGCPSATDLAAAVRASGVRLEPLRANRMDRSAGADDAFVVYLTRADPEELIAAAARISLALDTLRRVPYDNAQDIGLPDGR